MESGGNRWTAPQKRIVHAVGEKHYLMQFDNGEEKGLASSVLKVESMVAALPPDPLVPIPQIIREEAVLEAADEMLHEDEELEHLPEYVHYDCLQICHPYRDLHGPIYKVILRYHTGEPCESPCGDPSGSDLHG